MKFKTILGLVAFMMWMAGFSAKAQDVEEPVPLDTQLTVEIVDTIAAGYTPWTSMSMSGKLSSPLFPMSANVKVYMEKDQLVIISISAMIVGELARIEIDDKEALVINKYSGSYTTLDMAAIEPMCPGGLETLQNLLLGRITVIGSGTLKSSDAANVQIYPTAEGNLLMLPTQDIENAPYVYFYTLDPSNLTLQRFAVLAQSGDAEANCYYTKNSNNLTLDLVGIFGTRELGATLRLNNPDSKTKKLERTTAPASKYRKTDLKGILK